MAKPMNMDRTKSKTKPASKPAAGMQAKSPEASTAAPGKAAAKNRMNKSELLTK